MIVHIYRLTNIPRREQAWDTIDEHGRDLAGDTTLRYWRSKGTVLHRGAHPDPTKRRAVEWLLEADGRPMRIARLYWAEV